MLRKTRKCIQYQPPVLEASMRPQRNAAENIEPLAMEGIGANASMRPQRNAAENERTIVFCGLPLGLQ